MALKGSRRIVVREQSFRWTVSGKRGRFGGASPCPHLVVQGDTERPGKALVAYLVSKRWVSSEAHDLDVGGTVHKAVIRPKDVRAIIEQALDTGWDPSSKTTFFCPAGLDLTDYTSCEPPSRVITRR